MERPTSPLTLFAIGPVWSSGIYGGYAPQSWTSRRSQSLAARGGWLFRFTAGRFEFVDLLSRSMTVMHDYSNECIWLGKHTDLKLTRTCQQLDTVFVRPNTYHGGWDPMHVLGCRTCTLESRHNRASDSHVPSPLHFRPRTRLPIM